MKNKKQDQVARELQILSAKKAIKKSIGKHQGKLETKEEPEMAFVVLAHEIQGHLPIEQALVAEHMFRRTIEESIGVGIAGFDLDEQWVPGASKILVYRVLQEALNNVAKHSRAKRIKVTLRKTTNFIELTVEDDGQGFDAAQISGADRSSVGLGLEGMRERAELFGGKFYLDSRLGRGTAIKTLWPTGQA